MTTKIKKQKMFRIKINKKGVATAFHFFVILLLFIMMCITIMFFFWFVKFYNAKVDSYAENIGFWAGLIGEKGKVMETAEKIKIGGGDTHTVQSADVNIYDLIMSNIMSTNYNRFMVIENGAIKTIFEYKYNLITVLPTAPVDKDFFPTQFNRFARLPFYMEEYSKSTTPRTAADPNIYLLGYSSNMDDCNCLTEKWGDYTDSKLNVRHMVPYATNTAECTFAYSDFKYLMDYKFALVSFVSTNTDFCIKLYKVGRTATFNDKI